MAIDINQPVEPGHDVVLNFGDGSRLGSGEEFYEAAAKGLLTGVSLEPAKQAEVDAKLAAEAAAAEEPAPAPELDLTHAPEPEEKPKAKAKK